MQWKGVMPAITTTFNEQLEVDHEATASHVSWLIESGCSGIVVNGSLGEGATLTFEEKVALWTTCVAAVGDQVPIVASIASLSTDEAVRLANAALAAGCKGLMVLPPYVHKGSWRELRHHVGEIIRATKLSCMLYNNPIAYGVDFTTENISELAGEHENLHAVKESSGDVRRVTALKALLGDRLSILVGLDDALVEGVAAGATGWVAGLVNALPIESVNLFDYALSGERQKADALYKWFLPLLRLDTVPEFVQLIKLVQCQVGIGNSLVRSPRLQLTGSELENANSLIRNALASRPTQ